MDVKEKIKNLISENDVCLFMKGTPDSPQCGFSMAVSNLLKHLNVDYKGINVLEDEGLRQGIKDLINTNDVCLFMKGTPDSPQCGFSMAVSNVLKHLKVNFNGINILDDENLRQGVKEYSDWPTIPQLYVKGEFIGGCDIVKEMFEKGELKKLLEEKKLI